MGSDVGGEVVGAGEIPHADPALEGFLASVGPHVSGQFVTSAKSPEIKRRYY